MVVVCSGRNRFLGAADHQSRRDGLNHTLYPNRYLGLTSWAIRSHTCPINFFGWLWALSAGKETGFRVCVRMRITVAANWPPEEMLTY